MILPEGLLEEVRNYPGIDVTWEDEQVNVQLTTLIKMGMAYLNDKAGTELDYTDNLAARQLLMEYCKYARNGILDEFTIRLTPFLADLREKNGGAYGKTDI